MLQKLYNIAGVSGFVLSLLLACLELLRRFRFLRLSNVKLVPMFSDKQEGYIYISCTVTNPASVQIPLTGISLKLHGLGPLSAIQEQTMIFQRFSRSRNTIVEFNSTPLPINLPPRSAQRIVALFRLPASEAPQSLRLRAVDNHPAPKCIWVRVDLAVLSLSLPRYRRAAVADYRVEQEAFLKHPLSRS